MNETNSTTHHPEMVSVVIAAYNACDTLPAQLEALSAQTFAGRWELVIADNGSVDGTDQIEVPPALQARIRFIDASAKRGPAAARNAGVAAALGDLVLFCDADDVATPEWMAELVGALSNHALVGGPYELYALNPSWLAASRGRQRIEEVQTWAGVPLFAAGNLGVRKDVFEQIGGFDPEFRGHEDHELAIRFHVAGVTYQHCPAAVIHYRYRTDARGIFRQGLHYGGSHPALAIAARRHRLPTPRRIEWRPWAWLVVRLPRLVTRTGRLQYLWVVAVRLGRIRGSIRERSFFV